MSFDFSTLITDRTNADLRDLKSLLARIGSLTDEERAEFNLARHKGAYNYTDLNRVTEAMDYLDGVLKERGYVTGYQRITLPRQGTYQDVVLAPDSVVESEEYDTYIFTAPGTGKFVCEADYGTGVNSTTIEVVANEEYSADLSETKLWLYREGDECKDITGGWNFDGWIFAETGYINNQKEIKNADSISVNFPGSDGALSMIGTQLPVSTSGFSKICCLLDAISLGNYGWCMGLMVNYSKTISAYNGPAFGASATETGNNVVIKGDISSATDPVYIALESSTGSQWNVKSVWLE